MTRPNTQIARVRYNPEFAGYEAIVFVREDCGLFSYPSFVPAPLDADLKHVMRKLTHKALRKHRSQAPGLRSHRCHSTPLSLAVARPSLAA